MDWWMDWLMDAWTDRHCQSIDRNCLSNPAKRLNCPKRMCLYDTHILNVLNDIVFSMKQKLQNMIIPMSFSGSPIILQNSVVFFHRHIQTAPSGVDIQSVTLHDIFSQCCISERREQECLIMLNWYYYSYCFYCYYLWLQRNVNLKELWIFSSLIFGNFDCHKTCTLNSMNKAV